MWAINSIDELSILAEQRRPTAIFVATGFDGYAIDSVLDAWTDIHFKSEMRWHLAVPATIDRRSDREKPLRSEYNFHFSRQLMDVYGLNDTETPCLVFETFHEDRPQMHVKIEPNFDDFKSLILQIDKLISEIEIDGSDRNVELIWGRIFNAIAGRRLLRSVKKIAVPGTRYLLQRVSRQGLG